jgi:hypothetical protein
MSDERSLPPVTQLGMLSLSLIAAGVIDLAAHLPRGVSLAPPIALLSASAAVLAVSVASLRRADGFAWRRFLEVARWALLAYAIIAGLIEYVFLRNNTSGGPLVVLTLSLVVFALNVPVLIAFTVARYDDPQSADDLRRAS